MIQRGTDADWRGSMLERFFDRKAARGGECETGMVSGLG